MVCSFLKRTSPAFICTDWGKPWNPLSVSGSKFEPGSSRTQRTLHYDVRSTI